ncbi:hypothetical protein A6302_02788 [Methylobrevis pamukkalensis]|uniref:Lipoprotein n=2 Tax=Methylobrevis pamukkalensis TaxID=1439726 RepID=A0A1E3H280_9HYPH|nr:hypothetical protein A6302_02788 [Methylobrevis pamukkalensis]
MIRLSRLLVPALVLLAACNTTTPGGAPAGVRDGETLTKAMMERKLLDSCVYRQFNVVEKRNRMVEDCRCAARSAIRELPEGSYIVPRSGQLTGQQDLAVRNGIAACFKA